ncbi:MAG: hypothetical protein KC588_10985 [Nitrospira sp.]|nr:hypothetical protein [Nitrospira sp.]
MCPRIVLQMFQGLVAVPTNGRILLSLCELYLVGMGICLVICLTGSLLIIFGLVRFFPPYFIWARHI